jgi:hypothetical protein
MTQATAHVDTWLRVAPVALRLGVSHSQVLILIRRGELKARRHSASPRGMYLIRESEVVRYEAVEQSA